MSTNINPVIEQEIKQNSLVDKIAEGANSLKEEYFDGKVEEGKKLVAEMAEKYQNIKIAVDATTKVTETLDKKLDGYADSFIGYFYSCSDDSSLMSVLTTFLTNKRIFQLAVIIVIVTAFIKYRNQRDMNQSQRAKIDFIYIVALGKVFLYFLTVSLVIPYDLQYKMDIFTYEITSLHCCLLSGILFTYEMTVNRKFQL